jgi:hypothetical protein
LLCPNIDAELEYDGSLYPLATNRWVTGTVALSGYAHVISFRMTNRCRTFGGDAIAASG